MIRNFSLFQIIILISAQECQNHAIVFLIQVHLSKQKITKHQLLINDDNESQPAFEKVECLPEVNTQTNDNISKDNNYLTLQTKRTFNIHDKN